MSRGAVLGPYELLREIGSGGQGRMLLGFDPRLRRRVAIKLYETPASPGALGQFRDEARRLARVNSTRVVPGYDVLKLPHCLALVTGYVRGCDLRTVLRSGRISIGSTLALSRDVTAALAAARRAGVVHGDISPSNVLVSDGGRAVLGDFGAASLLGQTARLCSPAAATPEHLQGAPLDLRSDIFGLGLLMFWMLAGFHPFVQEGELDRDALQRGRFPSLRDVPGPRGLIARLERLLQRLLAPDPDRRPASIQEVRGELRAICRAVPKVLSGTVQREFGQHFRREEDLPVVEQVPGAQQLLPAPPAEPGPRRLGSLRALTLAALLAMALVTGVAVREPPLPWIIAVPELRIAAGSGPAGLGERNASALQGRFQRLLQRYGSRPVMLSQDRPVRLSMQGRELRTVSDAGVEVVLSVRCEQVLCLAQVMAGVPGTARATAQRVLFSDAAQADWDAALGALSEAVAAVP